MKTVLSISVLVLVMGVARADFSYTSTTKSAGGMAGGMTGDRVTKHFFKGNKMKIDNGDTAIILDFDAQTVTHVDNKQKTYTVTPFSQIGSQVNEGVKKSGAEISVDVKETGQRKNINGFNAHEVIMSMDMDSAQSRQAGMKMRMEMDMWISSEVPGAAEARAFYQKNAGRFPWAAIMHSGQSMPNGMVELQRKIATMNGVPVLQVVRMKSVGSEGQMADAQQKMAKACAQLEEMKAKGGQQATMAEQMMTRMNCKSGGGATGSLFEVTTESSGFSGGSVPESTFAIPAGYKQVERK